MQWGQAELMIMQHGCISNLQQKWTAFSEDPDILCQLDLHYGAYTTYRNSFLHGILYPVSFVPPYHFEDVYASS